MPAKSPESYLFQHARGGQENPAVYRRNVLRGPGQTNVDFSIGKQFNVRVRERQYGEFRAEFFLQSIQSSESCEPD